MKKAVLDLSDERNAVGQQFPVGYAETYLPEANSPLWRGLSIQEFVLWLPHEFKKAKAGTGTTDTSKKGTTIQNINSERIALFVRNALIDKQGFTGEITGQNILGKDEGKMGKWAFFGRTFIH